MLTRLTLTEFRSYPALTWRPGARLCVLTGPNGSGKTNLLEAVSLLVPGRGLRHARIADLGRHGQPWGVVGRFDHAAAAEIGTGTPPDGPIDRRTFRLDGAPVRNQADIAATFAAIWLTPQMDRLFGEAASGRRRFLDRLVWALEPGHAREVSAYETSAASRARLLAAGNADPAWIAALEDSMARHALAVTAARMALVAQLNHAMQSSAGSFPKTRIGLDDAIADRLAHDPALAVEDWLRDALARSRTADAASGSARWGAHRADMTLHDLHSGLPAALASTGQQKALLIGVVLGHAALIAAARGAAPLLLLDEPAVHLDPDRRAALWHALVAGPAQAILTGTDPAAFAGLEAHAEHWLTGGGTLRPDPSWAGRYPVLPNGSTL